MEDRTPQLFEHGPTLVRELVTGDLKLRLAGIPPYGTLPTVIFARKLRARLREVFLSKQRDWFFFFPISSKDWTVSDVVLDLTLEPDPNPVPELVSESQIFVNSPPFIVNPGDTGNAKVTLIDGKIMELSIKDGMPVGRVGNESFEAVEDWEFDRCILFVLMLIEWKRSRREGPLLPCDVSVMAESGPAKFIHQTARQLLAQYGGLRTWAANPEMQFNHESDPLWTEGLKKLRDVDPYLAAGYRVDRCLADIRVWIDSRGNIADKDDEPDQCAKLSFTANPEERDGVVRLILKADPPDIVADGDVHDGFMHLIRSDGFAKKMIRAIHGEDGDDTLHDVFNVGNKRLTAFLRAETPGGRAMFLRIARDPKSDVDTNLIFIEGTIDGRYGWILLLAKVLITTSNQVLFKNKLVYMACLDPLNEDQQVDAPSMGDDGDSHDHVGNYISAIVATCVTWHRILKQP